MRVTENWKRMVIVSAIAASVGMAATRAYFVEPRELYAGWTEAGPNAYVGQTFVANVDSIAYIEWFCAELSAEGMDVPLVGA